MRTRVMATFLGVAAFVAVAACGGDSRIDAPTSTPAASPLPTTIAEPAGSDGFRWRRGLYLVDPVDGRVDFVTSEIVTPTIPSLPRTVYDWSPDGTRLALIARWRDDPALSVYSVDDGQGVSVPLTDLQTAGELSWSPDGEQIAVTGSVSTSAGPESAIILFDLNTEQTTLLYGQPGQEFSPSGAPAWSPDGQRLALEVWDRKVAQLRIVVTNLQGEFETAMRKGRFPTWSPDGQNIAFARTGPGGAIYVASASAVPLKSVGEGLEAVWAPDGRRIAIQRGLGIYVLDVEIHRVDVEILAETRLAEGRFPAWSPDGRSIAFVREGGLYVVDSDGTEERQLAESQPPFIAVPKWSPDGSAIAFLYAPGVSSDVYTVDIDGTDETYLAPGFDPQWSPDGERIAFISGTGSLGFSGAIHMMNPDGTDIVRLAPIFIPTDVYFPETIYTWAPDSARLAFCACEPMKISVVDVATGERRQLLAEGWSFTWSPDGAHIAYVGVGPTIYTIDVDGPDFGPNVLAEGLAPAWSPDGRYIAYLKDGDIFVAEFPGGKAELVLETGSVARDGPLIWSPDGTRLAYEMGSYVYMLEVDGAGEPIRLAQGRDPSWAPDGQRIAFVGKDSVGNRGIYLIAADGSTELRFLTEGYDPAWSPDGSRVAFTR